ncbi:helix-turn-helix domain-containing protein [Paenibacillus sp. Leaf72]|uniref:helix-turn-helix domain-containing protein n=1 Tax=Paenibacillus sp. Leaf72 TaxID=1736234 RepID=UPI0007C69B3E|nr:AraC family transcriptional regulator [Paenibacillus sp. Leaf72]
MKDELMVSLQTPPLPYYWEAGRADFRAGDRHPNRKHFGLFDLLLVVNGALHIGEDGKEWSLGAGDTLLLLPEGEHYSVKPCEQETIFYWVHFEHKVWRQAPAIAKAEATAPSSPFDNPKLIHIPKHASLPNPQIAFDLMRQLLELPIGEAFWEKQHLLFQLLALLENGRSGMTSTPATRLAEKAASYLQRNYQEEITNETLALALHFHPNYIVRCMKMKYGVTPIHYLLQFRMERAKQLLVSTEWSVDRIAEEVGFRYSPYFSTCFKRSVGMTPLHFRKKYLN